MTEQIIDDSEQAIIPFVSTPDILTFNCNRGEEADLYNDERKCCCFLTWHTYPLILRADLPSITGIAGVGGTGPSEANEFFDVNVEMYVNETWNIVATIPMHTDRNTPFEIYFDPGIPATKFRFRPLANSVMDLSYGRVQFGTPANQHLTQQECVATGCYWYNGSCHLMPPLCKQLATQTDCEAFGCYWALDGCHPMPGACEGWLTMDDCVNYGCQWYGEGTWLPNTCHPQGTLMKKLSMDPNEPADIYSSTPPYSQWAYFDLGEAVELYRFKGQLQIYADGQSLITQVSFLRGDTGVTIKILPSCYTDWITDFDFYPSDHYPARYLKIGSPASAYGVTLKLLNFVLLYRSV